MFVAIFIIFFPSLFCLGGIVCVCVCVCVCVEGGCLCAQLSMFACSCELESFHLVLSLICAPTLTKTTTASISGS